MYKYYCFKILLIYIYIYISFNRCQSFPARINPGLKTIIVNMIGSPKIYFVFRCFSFVGQYHISSVYTNQSHDATTFFILQEAVGHTMRLHKTDTKLMGGYLAGFGQNWTVTGTCTHTPLQDAVILYAFHVLPSVKSEL